MTREIFCPLPIHAKKPDPYEIELTHIWLNRFKLVKDHSATARLAQSSVSVPANLFPNANDDQMRDYSDYVAWLYIWDDLFDLDIIDNDYINKIKICYSISAIVNNPEHDLLKNNPMAEGIRDIVARIRRWATPPSIDFFTKTFDQWISSYIWELSIKQRRDTFSLDEFYAFRTRSVACDLVLFMSEASNGVCLSFKQRQDPLIRALTESFYLVMTLDNDIFSRAKSKISGEDTFDLVDALMIRRDMNEIDAGNYVTELRNQAMALYLRLRNDVFTIQSKTLNSYVTCCDDCLTGNIVLGASSIRYLNKDNAYLNSKLVDFVELSDNFLPDIASISWMWKIQSTI